MKKMIPNEAREGFAINKAYEFLNEFKKLTLPINLYDLCSFHDITLMTYTELIIHGEKLDISETESKARNLPNDGFVMMIDGTPYIFYNEKRRNKRRIRFTIAHEIGHIILGHLDDFDLTVLRRDESYSKQYEVLESEANNFARNILTPYPLLKNIYLDSFNQWKEYFHITDAAARTRLSRKDRDRNLVLPKERNEFKTKFEKLIALPLILKRCKRCKSSSALENAKFCKYCGFNELTKTYPQIGDRVMKYPEVSHTNGKMDQCPICENEEILDGANHCNQCGVYLLNYCYNYVNSNGYDDFSKCSSVLPYNSRCCHICGQDSTYLRNKLLKSWEEEQKMQKEQEEKLRDPFAIAPQKDFFKIDDSDDMPF